ncbi:MAG: hypothetical protein U1E76_21650 [Planctomycetota bacterium]
MDGSTWTRQATSTPTARAGHAMAYDSGRGVTVLFGGYDAAHDAETWEGTAAPGRGVSPRWRPAPRAGHAMAYDDARGVTVLFGGYDGDYLADTWEWTATPGRGGRAWATMTAGARLARCVAYDSASRHGRVRRQRRRADDGDTGMGWQCGRSAR